MGADGAHVLGYGAALPGWHRLRLMAGIVLDVLEGSVLGLNALGLVVIAHRFDSASAPAHVLLCSKQAWYSRWSASI